MGALFKMLFAVLLVAIFITVVLYFVASIIGGIVFNPESRAWKSMLETLRARLRKQSVEALASIDAENLAQLSLKPILSKKAGWRDNTFEGSFNTIYKEPLVCFAGQKAGKTAVIVARTRENEYIFRQKGKETEIWQDGQPYAVFVDGALLSAGKQARLLAKLETDPELRQWPIVLGNNEAATLTNAERTVSPIPRALTLMRNLNPVETQALLVLSLMKGLEH